MKTAARSDAKSDAHIAMMALHILSYEPPSSASAAADRFDELVAQLRREAGK